MKAVPLILALLATTTMASAFAEGGAERLQEHHDRWALQMQQQKQQALAKETAARATQEQAQAPIGQDPSAPSS